MPKQQATETLDKKPYIALFTIIVTLLLVILVSATEKTIQYLRVQREMTEKFVIRSGNDFLVESITSAVTDTFLLTETIQSNQETTIDYNYKLKKTEEFLVTFAKFKEQYSRIRIIGVDGKEIIDVKNGYNPTVLKNDTTDYSDVDYFKKTINLTKGNMYVSGFDFNSNVDENSKSTIKFCTPITTNGKNVGILVLTFNIDSFFEQLNDLAYEFDTSFNLLTSEGYVLSTNYEQSPILNKTTLNEEFMDEWNVLIRSEPGQIGQEITENGLFTYLKIDLPTAFSNSPVDVSKVSFQADVLYLTVYTFRDSGYEKIFITSKFQDIIYAISGNIFYIILIVLIAGLTTALLYFRGLSIKRIKFNSDYDALTATYNRRAGIALAESILNSENVNHLPMSVCFIDINGLKEVNDTLGHQYGDELISTASKNIQKMIRSNDIFMRVGGDEFILLLMNCSTDQAEEVWSKIVNTFNYINLNENRPYNISLSHGILEYNHIDASELETVIAAADQLMYENKKNIKKNFNAIK